MAMRLALGHRLKHDLLEQQQARLTSSATEVMRCRRLSPVRLPMHACVSVDRVTYSGLRASCGM